MWIKYANYFFDYNKECWYLITLSFIFGDNDLRPISVIAHIILFQLGPLWKTPVRVCRYVTVWLIRVRNYWWIVLSLYKCIVPGNGKKTKHILTRFFLRRTRDSQNWLSNRTEYLNKMLWTVFLESGWWWWVFFTTREGLSNYSPYFLSICSPSFTIIG